MTNINDILTGNPKKNIKKNIPKKKLVSGDTEEKHIGIDKGGRPRKDVIYAKERKDILDKILNILSISKTGDIFYIDDLDGDIEKQNQILELEDDIKKCFSCSNWKCFMEDAVLKKYISMVKYIFKQTNIEMTAVSLVDTQKRKVLRHGFIIKL